MNEQQIRKYIQKILNEEEEKPKKEKKKKVTKIKAGEIGLSVGGGGFTKVVADAGALATKNPKQLMDNLEIKSGGKDFNGAQTIIKQALDGSDVMQKAYGGLRKISKGSLAGFGSFNGCAKRKKWCKVFTSYVDGCYGGWKVSVDSTTSDSSGGR